MKSTSRLHAAGQFVCQHWFPAKGGCLLQLHVVQSIDAFLGPLSPQKALTAACQAGALESTLEYFLSRTTPIWKEALRAAAKGGHLHVLRWMTNRQDGRGPWKADFDNLLEVAASHGHLDVSKWLFERGADWYTMWRLKRSTPGYYAKAWSYRYELSEGLVLAAENGHLAVVQWLHGVQTQKISSTPMYCAVAGGHMVVAQWLFENGAKNCSTNAADAAAREGNLEMLQWLHSKQLLHCTTRVFDKAATNGHLAVLQWLHKIIEGGCSSAKLYLPIRNGHLEVVKWLDANVPVYVDRELGSSSTFAARNGHLKILKWLHKRFTNCFSVYDMDVAAESGHLNVMMWLHEHRTEGCTDTAPWRAARIGHLKMVQWLHENYSDNFSEDVMDVAAENGHLDVVQWLHENRSEGCTTEAMDRAADRGCLDVVLWLLTHRTEGFSSSSMETPLNVEVLYSSDHEFSTTESLNGKSECGQLRELHSVYKLRPAFVEGCLRCVAEIAFGQGHIHILNWLRKFDMKLLSTAPIRRAVSEGDLNMVKWFHQNYFELCERDLLQLAVQNGHMDVTRWLFEHGYEINTSELVVAAAESNNVTLVRWLIENGRTLDASTAAMLAKNDDYVEAMWWVPEPERVQLVLEAMHDENRKLLWWLLMRTRFEEKISYIAISGAIDEAAASMREWLLDNIDDDEVCRWCFSESERCQVVKLRRRNPYHLPNGLAAIRFLCSYILVMHSTNSTIAHLINTLL